MTHTRLEPFDYYVRLQQLRAWVEEGAEVPLTCEAAAAEANMSRASFSRFFRQATGCTFGAWRDAARVERAHGLVARRNYSIVEIAEICGYGSVRTLQRHFKRRYGCNISEHRSLCRKDALRTRGDTFRRVVRRA